MRRPLTCWSFCKRSPSGNIPTMISFLSENKLLMKQSKKDLLSQAFFVFEIHRAVVTGNYSDVFSCAIKSQT